MVRLFILNQSRQVAIADNSGACGASKSGLPGRIFYYFGSFFFERSIIFLNAVLQLFRQSFVVFLTKLLASKTMTFQDAVASTQTST
jgi:hypothetical protein